MSVGRTRKQRPHKPTELGPRIYARGRYFQADLRPWSMGRVTLRNPDDPGWPDEGERTTERDIAERWKWRYVALARGEHRRRVLHLPAKENLISTLTQRYLDDRLETVERATWSADRTAIGYLLESFGDLTPSEVTTDRLRDWMHGMLRRGYRPNTLRAYLTSMASFFRTLDLRPTKGLVIPDRGTQDVRVWTDPEVERIREAASKVDAQRIGKFASCRLAVEVGLSMGLRQSEIFGLRWEDIREKDGVVRVDRQTIKDRKGTKPLKGKRSRTAVVLSDWWPLHRQDIGPVFGEISYRPQRNMIERVLDTAGLNGLGTGFHSLRHTYASRYLLSGGTIFGLQKSLGHSSVLITERRYSHLTGETVAEMEAARMKGTARDAPRRA